MKKFSFAILTFTSLLALTILVSMLPASVLQAHAAQLEETIQPESELPKKNTASHGVDLIASGSCGEAAVWALDNAGTLTISGTGPMTDFPSYSPLDAIPWKEHWSSIKHVVIANGITTVGNTSFIHCNNLTY